MEAPKEIYILKTKAPDDGLGISYHLHPIETEKTTSVKYIRADIAEHFYNLALEDVRKEVREKRDFTPESEDGLQRRYAYDVILDLIDLLIEELQTT